VALQGRRIVVIGGGIAGLSAAYFLRRDGADFVVLEAARVGAGASSGNAGWVCPAQAGPLPGPGLVTFGIKSLFNRDSSLYIAPPQLPAMAGWLLRFARRCNVRDQRRGTEALARLGRRTFALLDQYSEVGVEFASHRLGMLVVAEQHRTAEEFLRALAPLRQFGFEIPRRLLGATQTREREPLLSAATAAGIPIAQHVHVDPMSLIEGLAAHLRRTGVAIEERAAVDVVVATNGRVDVSTGGARHVADAAIVATGAWTAPFMRRAGAWVPIAAGKGYSFEVPSPPNPAPRSALLLLDAHLGISPLSGRLRVAGTMEFSGLNTRVDGRRVDAIARGASTLLPDLDLGRRINVWAGMRPIAPDGLPVIDRVPGADNVYVAGGYSMLGMTLAAPAGEALAEMVRTGRRPAVLEPFRIDRFRSLGRR
jgi:D-amino-acid dehydrogenase